MSLAGPLANFRPVGMRANVLIVDDDSGFRDTLEDLLVDEGYTVTVARHGAHALGMLPHVGRPALILLDLQMPVMDGVTFLDHLQQWPDHADFETVIMSGGVSREWLEKVPHTVRALTKPFDVEEILTLVAEFAERHASPSGSATTASNEPATFVAGTVAPPDAPEQ